MRLFVAASPPVDVVEELDEFLAVRRDALPQAGLRWTLPEQWHLTLAFAAAAPERAYDGIVERLRLGALTGAPVQGAITGGGAFPHPGQAKVLWAGVEVEDPAGLDRLAAGARTALATAGVQVAGERFRPHLTLARMARPIEATRWIRVLDAYRGPRFEVEQISLVASYLGEGPRRRPRYEVLETFPLGRAA